MYKHNIIAKPDELIHYKLSKFYQVPKAKFFILFFRSDFVFKHTNSGQNLDHAMDEEPIFSLSFIGRSHLPL